MTFVFMRIDELGDHCRAEGHEFLNKKHTFPDFEETDSAMVAAYWAWKNTMEESGQRIWEEIYGPECRIFLEETYESQFRKMHFPL